MLPLLPVWAYKNSTPPPDPSSGQTPAWRLFDTQGQTLTVDAASDLNLKYYTGSNSYLRPVGPRYGPAANPTWTGKGEALRVPTGNSAVKFNARGDMAAETAFKTIGMYGGWFRFSHMGSAFKRLFGSRGDGGTATSGGPETWCSVRLNGTSVELAKCDSAVGNNLNATSIGTLNQWFWISICHEWSGGQYKWRLYYRTAIDATMTQIGSQSSFGGDRRSPLICLQSTNDGSLDDVSTGSAWSGCIGAFSAYELDAIATGATYPADIVVPSELIPATWYVSASASGGGSGTSSSSAWTEAEFLNELTYGTVRGSYIGLKTASGEEEIVPKSQAEADDFRDLVEAGGVYAAGDTISFAGTINQTKDYGLENFPGVRATGTATLTTLRTLTGTFTQPNAGTYPNVWQKLDTVFVATRSGVDGYSGSCVIIDGYIYTPVAGANLAAVISTINSNVKRSYADASGVYFHSATDPNSNGLTKQYVFPLANSPVTSTTGAQIIINTGVVDGLTIIGGPVYAHQAAGPDYVAVYNVGVVHQTAQRAIVSGTMRGGSKHNVCLTGTGIEGALVLGCEFQAGSGISYTAYTTSSSAAEIYSRALSTMIETSYQLIGSQESTTPTVSYSSVYTHNNGAAQQQFGTFADDVPGGEGDVFLGTVDISSSLELPYP